MQVAQWPALTELLPIKIDPLPTGLSPASATPSSDAQVQSLIEQCCDQLISAEDDLNSLDAKSGDGDTGSTLAVASRALKTSVQRLPLADSKQLFTAIGNELPDHGRLLGCDFGNLFLRDR